MLLCRNTTLQSRSVESPDIIVRQIPGSLPLRWANKQMNGRLYSWTPLVESTEENIDWPCSWAVVNTTSPLGPYLYAAASTLASIRVGFSLYRITFLVYDIIHVVCMCRVLCGHSRSAPPQQYRYFFLFVDLFCSVFFFFLFDCLFVWLFTCLFVYLIICLFVCLFVNLFVYMFLCPVCLFARLLVCLLRSSWRQGTVLPTAEMPRTWPLLRSGSPTTSDRWRESVFAYIICDISLNRYCTSK